MSLTTVMNQSFRSQTENKIWQIDVLFIYFELLFSHQSHDIHQKYKQTAGSEQRHCTTYIFLWKGIVNNNNIKHGIRTGTGSEVCCNFGEARQLLQLLWQSSLYKALQLASHGTQELILRHLWWNHLWQKQKTPFIRLSTGASLL